MKLYLFERTGDAEYGTYRKMLVAADDQGEAAELANDYQYKSEGWQRCDWQNVEGRIIGEPSGDIERGVVLSDYVDP